MAKKPKKGLEYFQAAVEAAGGQTALARLLNTSQERVWYHLNRSHKCPAEWVHTLCDAAREAGMKCKPSDLRPDISWEDK